MTDNRRKSIFQLLALRHHRRRNEQPAPGSDNLLLRFRDPRDTSTGDFPRRPLPLSTRLRRPCPRSSWLSARKITTAAATNRRLDVSDSVVDASDRAAKSERCHSRKKIPKWEWRNDGDVEGAIVVGVGEDSVWASDQLVVDDGDDDVVGAVAAVVVWERLDHKRRLPFSEISCPSTWTNRRRRKVDAEGTKRTTATGCRTRRKRPVVEN